MINYEIPIKPEPGVIDNPVTKRNPLDPAPLVAVFDRWAPEIDKMANMVQGLVVKDAETSATAAEMAAQARKLINAIDKKRREVVAPYHDVKSTVDMHCRKVTQHLLQIQREAEHRNTEYLRVIESLRLDEEKAAIERTKRFTGTEQPVAVTMPATETKIKTESGGTKLEFKLVPVITDFKSLPDACYEARRDAVEKAIMPWINAQIKAGVAEIPGVAITKQPVVKTRVR